MTGATLGPFEAWLILRVASKRWRSACSADDSARRIAAYLDACPKVEKVYYPGLPTHPGHDIAERQMRDFGGMISLRSRAARPA